MRAIQRLYGGSHEHNSPTHEQLFSMLNELALGSLRAGFSRIDVADRRDKSVCSKDGTF